MGRHSRRQLLHGSLALAGFSLLSGCERPGQQVSSVPRIGFLAVGSREGRAFVIDGFLKGLREHGYVEGKSLRKPGACFPWGWISSIRTGGPLRTWTRS